MAMITEEAIRPADLMSQKQACVDADREYLLARRAEWVAAACPACDATTASPYGEKNGFTYVVCDDCRTVYTNPRPSLQLLHDFYSQSQNYAFWNEWIFPATEAARRDKIFRPRAERLRDFCQKFGIAGGTFLEVGAAFGTFCEEVRKQELFEHIVAVEPTPGLAETCRQRGFETREAFVETIDETNFARVVAAFEVIEHLFSPREFISNCRRLLEPGGLLVLSCPNAQGFDVSTLGMASGTFDHEHLNYFNPQSLARRVTDCGFEVLEVQTPGQLDVDLVRTAVQQGRCSLDAAPFLKTIVVDRHEELAEPFQRFLAENCLSSHLWIVARKV